MKCISIYYEFSFFFVLDQTLYALYLGFIQFHIIFILQLADTILLVGDSDDYDDCCLCFATNFLVEYFFTTKIREKRVVFLLGK